jgi:radical SAM superfamily enzyme YgiQ (UPF0313 family)
VFRLTLIFPAIGHRVGQPYLRSWQMEPLPTALLAALTPHDVEVRFYDDRLERIPFDEPTDLVALSVETYCARRAYQIASEYRRRRVPVVMGGFHASLCPDEVARYAEAVVVGEAEQLWPRVIDDFRHGTPQKFYRAESRPLLNGVLPNRRILHGKRYLPLTLVEASRGCQGHCEFCSVQSMFHNSQNRRPGASVLSELGQLRRKRGVFFFVDDNLTGNLVAAKEFFRALVPFQIKWIGQAGVQVAYDEECLALMEESGCMGVLIGFESLDPRNLEAMHKPFNAHHGGYAVALANLRRHDIGVFGTFVFGYDHDTPESFSATLRFAQEQGLYLAAFNHVVPFPGTPLYRRLEAEGRLLSPAWWLDERYRFNQVVFRPKHLSPQELRRCCLESRKSFYSLGSIWQRRQAMGGFDLSRLRHYVAINLMHRVDVRGRDGFPLGDEAWQGQLLPAD